MKMAIDKGILDFEAVDLRDYTHDRHHTTDDIPFGGGAGMMFLPRPLMEALDAIDDPAGSCSRSELRTGRPPDTAHGGGSGAVARRCLLPALEGIDERVMETARPPHLDWRRCAMGGEIAAIEIIDAMLVWFRAPPAMQHPPATRASPPDFWSILSTHAHGNWMVRPCLTFLFRGIMPTLPGGVERKRSEGPLSAGPTFCGIST